jgi:hypothetical protein
MLGEFRSRILKSRFWHALPRISKKSSASRGEIGSPGRSPRHTSSGMQPRTTAWRSSSTPHIVRNSVDPHPSSVRESGFGDQTNSRRLRRVRVAGSGLHRPDWLVDFFQHERGPSRPIVEVRVIRGQAALSSSFAIDHKSTQLQGDFISYHPFGGRINLRPCRAICPGRASAGPRLSSCHRRRCRACWPSPGRV